MQIKPKYSIMNATGSSAYNPTENLMADSTREIEFTMPEASKVP